MNMAMDLPTDVRLMQISARLLAGMALVAVVASLLMWTLRHPRFDFRSIVIDTPLRWTNPLTVRAHAAPQLSGNFFTLDLQHARAAFEGAPWVRLAEVRREFPGRLHVRLEEHEPVALWGEESDASLVNRQGQVFEASSPVTELDDMPVLFGPAGTSGQVLALYQRLRPELLPLTLDIEKLELTAHGGWRIRADSGALIELGRGSDAELVERLRRFARTLPSIASRYGRRAADLEAADLRYASGYALRLNGVGAVETSAKPAPNPQLLARKRQN
jgi:cell division protein FtsQ